MVRVPTRMCASCAYYAPGDVAFIPVLDVLMHGRCRYEDNVNRARHILAVPGHPWTLQLLHVIEMPLLTKNRFIR